MSAAIFVFIWVLKLFLLCFWFVCLKLLSVVGSRLAPNG